MQSKLFDKIPTNIKKDRKWLETELDAAHALYDKLSKDIDEEDFPLPTPAELIMLAPEYKTMWQTYKNTKIEQYVKKHNDTLQYKKKIQADKVDYWTRTPEENIAAAVKKLEEGTQQNEYVIPDDFETDTQALRDFLGSELCSYIAMVIALNDIVNDHFPTLILTNEQTRGHTETVMQPKN